MGKLLSQGSAYCWGQLEGLGAHIPCDNFKLADAN